MTPPAAYGLLRLLFLLFGPGGSAALAYALRRCGAVCCRVLLGEGLFLICCETYKLLFYDYVIGNGSFRQPFHFFRNCVLCFRIFFASGTILPIMGKVWNVCCCTRQVTSTPLFFAFSATMRVSS